MVLLVSSSGQQAFGAQAKAMRLQMWLWGVGSRPGCLARAKCAFCVERSKIAVKSVSGKGVRGRIFSSQTQKRALLHAPEGHAGRNRRCCDECLKIAAEWVPASGLRTGGLAEDGRNSCGFAGASAIEPIRLGSGGGASGKKSGPPGEEGRWEVGGGMGVKVRWERRTGDRGNGGSCRGRIRHAPVGRPGGRSMAVGAAGRIQRRQGHARSGQPWFISVNGVRAMPVPRGQENRRKIENRRAAAFFRLLRGDRRSISAPPGRVRRPESDGICNLLPSGIVRDALRGNPPCPPTDCATIYSPRFARSR